MNIRNHIINDINALDSDRLLQAFHFLDNLKKEKNQSNQFIWKKFVAIIGDNEAKEMKKTINQEFNNIEGDW